MDFGEVLSKSWRIVWKHKVLWIFGILAGCARGGGGGGGSGGDFGGQSSGTGSQPFGQGFSPGNPQFGTEIEQWISTHVELLIAAVILFILLIFLIALIRLALGTIGQVGLIRGAAAVDGGAEQLRFGELFKSTYPYFWRVLGLSLLVAAGFFILIMLGVVMLVGLALAAGLPTAGVGGLVVLPLLCILIPVVIILGVVVDIIVQLADLSIVIEDLSLTAGVRRGWELFKKELGPVLLIWLITVVAGFIVGIVIAIPMVFVVIGTVIPLVANSGTFSWTPIIAGGACLLLYLPVLLAISGLLLAYLQSVWTLTYLRLTRNKPVDPTAPPLPANA